MTRRARTIFWKELRETLRDKRVIFGVFVSPLLVIPAMMFAFGGLVAQRTRTERAEMLAVGVLGQNHLPDLTRELAASESLDVHHIESRDAAEAAVRDGTLRAVLVVPDDAANQLADDHNVSTEILFDAANDRSRTAHNRLRAVVARVSRLVETERLAARGLDRSMLDPVRVTDRNLASQRRVGGFLLGSILPYVALVMAAFGGLTSAIDTGAGEKERGTLETLLVSPATRREIIVGKLGVIALVSVLSALCALIGLVVAIESGFRAAAAMGLQRMDFSYANVAALLLILIPMVLMTSSLLLALSAFARNPKEAQAYVFPFTIVVILPGMAANLLGVETHLLFALVPILNTGLAMKQVLAGAFDLPFLVLTLVSSLAYAAMLMRLVMAMFERESILFRT